jgi:hypothetical protein
MFLFMKEKSVTECIRITFKNPEDGYVAVETLVCLLHEMIHSVMWVVPRTFHHNGRWRRVVSFRLQPLYTHGGWGGNLAARH